MTAWVGGRRLVLRTPGLHSGEAGRDWVGYLDRVGLDRSRQSLPHPLERQATRPPGPASPAVYLPVRLRISYPDETAVTGTLPRVFLSPGWG